MPNSVNAELFSQNPYKSNNLITTGTLMNLDLLWEDTNWMSEQNIIEIKVPLLDDNIWCHPILF